MSVTESKCQFQASLQDNGNDVINFLKSGKSCQQYNRDRMDTCFETPKATTERVDNEIRKEQTGKKPKKHHGKFQKYQFDKDAFLKDINQKQPGSFIK